jgi:hypothetical protein
MAAPLLAPDGWMLCTTNQHSLTDGIFRRLIVASLPASNRRKIDAAPMPADFTGDQYLHTAWIK